MVIEADAFVHLEKLSNLFLSGNSLTSVPKLPSGLQILSLEGNKIFKITSPLGTPQLKYLSLTKNCFYANPCNETFFVKEEVFHDLPVLQNLMLGFNNITRVPLGLPHSLESLDLRENKISEISEMDFANLTGLKNLNLEWNCQRCDHAAQPCFPCQNNASIKLSPKVFQNQTGLVSLSLRGNSLTNISDALFESLVSLSSLDLSDNLLAYEIRNGTFYKHLKNVTTLNLLYNYQPKKTFANLQLSDTFSSMESLEELLISGYFFHELMNLKPLANLKKLQTVDFRMNFLHTVNMSIFSSLPSLTKVVLSQNMMDFPPPCASNTYGSAHEHQGQGDGLPVARYVLNTKPEHQGEINRSNLNPDMWYFQKKYCKDRLFFDLSQNNILSLRENIFLGMESAVCLDLSSNYISQSLNGSQFSALKNLSYLNLAQNRIDLYYDNAFQELRGSLRALDLTNNKYHFLMKGMGHSFEFLPSLMSLKVLSLSQNNIGIRISPRLVSSSLKYLFFSDNRLDIMWDLKFHQYLDFFQNLNNLTFLDLSNNKLRSITPEALHNLPQSLETLKVNNNRLNFFPWSNLTVLHKIVYLNLSYNSLFGLPKEAIDFGKTLQILDLSHNMISRLPILFFSNAATLKTLLLNHNKLKFFNSQNLPFLLRGNLSSLSLHANPFICTCDSSLFIDFLRNTKISIPYLSTEITCGFPESQLGEKVLSMDPRSCQEIYGSLSFICTFILTILFIAMPLLKKLFGWDLWYSLQFIWAGNKGYSLLTEADNQFDAFIVFDTRNTAVMDWVFNDLRVNLEDRGRPRFKLCLEERDWVPGNACIQNLYNAVYNSRKTVFVLTRAGSICGVLRQAFFMVQQRLLDEKVDVVVLVLLDEIFPKSRYIQMRKILCRKSVLTWPRNPRAHQHFWNSMRSVLGSDNSQNYDSNVSESFLSLQFH
ncbi:toll-like receptor 9 [Amia ocellicauda]|uniref:toll-like receptor 9 n=1 Tax=Amia ocellicauda TaxID=2972642 RepID=UPI0034639BCB